MPRRVAKHVLFQSITEGGRVGLELCRQCRAHSRDDLLAV